MLLLVKGKPAIHQSSFKTRRAFVQPNVVSCQIGNPPDFGRQPTNENVEFQSTSVLSFQQN